MAACQNRARFPENQPPTDPIVSDRFAATLFDLMARAVPDPLEWETWEGRQGASLTRRQRRQIGNLVEALIGLLDAADPDDEDCPVYPGNHEYIPAPEAWRNGPSCWMTNLDTDSEEGEDREHDDCDDEPETDEDNGDTEPRDWCWPTPNTVRMQIAWQKASGMGGSNG